MNNTDIIFDGFLGDYDRAIDGLKSCLPSYEIRCQELMDAVAKTSSDDECELFFERLYEIQSRLARLLFVRQIDLGDRLNSLVREFDGLHDSYIKNYWAQKFRSGIRWPS